MIIFHPQEKAPSILSYLAYLDILLYAGLYTVVRGTYTTEGTGEILYVPPYVRTDKTYPGLRKKYPRGGC